MPLLIGAISRQYRLLCQTGLYLSGGLNGKLMEFIQV